MTNHTNRNDLDLERVTKNHWDAVIVGAGMGGASMAWSLSRAGLNVLLVEKGRSDARYDPTVHESDPELRLRVGVWPTMMRTCVDGKTLDSWPLLGCGVGGSSLLYGATLQRFEPEDFDVPESPWPFRYADLEPFYQQAERLFNVHGSTDPLSAIEESSYDLQAPFPMSEYDHSLHQSFKASGLHPYRLHIAMAPKIDCPLCEANRCTLDCRLDAKQACLDPLTTTGKLTILDQTDVIEIRFHESDVDHLVAQHREQRIELRGKRFVLAAGAISTPKILLNSRSERFPSGVGNEHDVVGRNLMFHVSDVFAIWSKHTKARAGFQKSLAFRDFYDYDGFKYGEVQSMGFPTSQGDILHFLHGKFWRSPFRHIPPLRHALRVPAYLASKIFREAAVYSSIVQDFPYPTNRVVLDDSAPDGIRLDYNICDELKARVEKFRKLLKVSFSGLRLIRLNQDISLNLGHPCGTCRAGVDSKSSVVDSSMKVHGTTNLFIADASVFSTSGGTNPSLTVAACALRCAQIILDEH